MHWVCPQLQLERLDALDRGRQARVGDLHVCDRVQHWHALRVVLEQRLRPASQAELCGCCARSRLGSEAERPWDDWSAAPAACTRRAAQLLRAWALCGAAWGCACKGCACGLWSAAAGHS